MFDSVLDVPPQIDTLKFFKFEQRYEKMQDK